MTDADWSLLADLMRRAEGYATRIERRHQNRGVEAADVIRVAFLAVGKLESLENFLATFAHEYLIEDGQLTHTGRANE